MLRRVVGSEVRNADMFSMVRSCGDVALLKELVHYESFTSKTVPILDNQRHRKIFQSPWTNTQCLILTGRTFLWREMKKVDIVVDGPFHSVFGGTVARVLDEARIVGNMEQTVSMLSESTKLDYKTVQTALDRLAKYGMVKKSRRVGNAQTYRFNVENDLHPLLNWAAEFQHSKRNRR